MEKLKALAQYLGIDYFTHTDRNGFESVYIGMTQEEYDDLESELLDKFDTREEVDEELENKVDGLSLLEEEIEESSYRDYVFEYGSEEYLVCTDNEADIEWDENLEQYIEDCVLPEIPSNYRSYFDSCTFKKDCEIDGRGHSLASYDGIEYEASVNGTEYYIYRIN